MKSPHSFSHFPFNSPFYESPTRLSEYLRIFVSQVCTSARYTQGDVSLFFSPLILCRLVNIISSSQYISHSALALHTYFHPQGVRSFKLRLPSPHRGWDFCAGKPLLSLISSHADFGWRKVHRVLFDSEECAAARIQKIARTLSGQTPGRRWQSQEETIYVLLWEERGRRMFEYVFRCFVVW